MTGITLLEGRETDIPPDVTALTPHTVALTALLLAPLLAGCAATPAAPPDPVVFHDALPPDWQPPAEPDPTAQPGAEASAIPPAPEPGPGWRERTSKVAGATGRGLKTAAVVVGRGVATGATAVGRGMGTAYRGVSRGFQRPEAQAEYGPYPDQYAELIPKHFVHVLDFPRNARFKLALPQRGYMNKGLLLGGGVAWQGWVVEVEVQLDGGWGRDEPVTQQYSVRIRDDFVVDVHKGKGVLHVLDGESHAQR